MTADDQNTEPRESKVEVQDADSPLKASSPASPLDAAKSADSASTPGTASKILAAAKTWLSDPMNIGLLLWILAVTAAGGIMFMVMVGMLNAVIPSEEARKVWLEASNQVLNALFTLWVFLVQPWRIMYLIWVCRWDLKDRRRLRDVFSRAGPDYGIPKERLHMAVVVVLLNLNCLLQYCLAGVMWGIRWEYRSGVLVGCLLGSAFGCVAIAGLYCLFSPLGRPRPPEPQMTLHRKSLEELCKRGSIKSVSLSSGGDLELQGIQEQPKDQSKTASLSNSSQAIAASRSSEPRITIPINEDIGWQGPLWGCAEDWKSAVGTLFCFCYTFGNNLQRAGFGNKFLHMVMLLAFLLGPFLVCFFAGTQVYPGNPRTAVAIMLSGIVVSYFGLLYGGYWRSQLVHYFRLPQTRPCGMDCGPVGECGLWLTCCCCAVCQEIRTIKRYGLHVDFHPEISADSQMRTAEDLGEDMPDSKQVEASVFDCESSVDARTTSLSSPSHQAMTS